MWALLCLAAFLQAAGADLCENRPQPSIVLLTAGETKILGMSALFGPELPKAAPATGTRLDVSEPVDACKPLGVR